MSKASRLSGSPINCHPHVNHILNLSKQIVQITITHIEGHVSYEEGFGRRVDWTILRILVGPAWRAVGGRTGAGQRVLNRKTAALKVLEVEELDGAAGGFNIFKFDVAESVSIRHSISNCHGDVYAFMCRDSGKQGMEGGNEPFTQTSLIHDNLRVNNRSRSLKFFLQILAPHIKEQISHIHRFSRLSTRGAPTSFGCLRSKSSSSTKTLRGARGDFTCGLHSGFH